MTRPANILCLLLAVAGLSFGIGQMVGQDRAQADAQAARVLKVKDSAAKSYLQFIFRALIVQTDELRDIKAQARATCLNVKPPNDAYGSHGEPCPEP